MFLQRRKVISSVFLASLGIGPLRALSFVLTALYVLFAVYLYKRTKSFGWLLVTIFIYAYCLHHFLVAELYWAIGASVYWFRYPYFVAQNIEFYQAWFLHAVFVQTYLLSVLIFIKVKKGRGGDFKPFAFFPGWPTFVLAIIAVTTFVYLWFPWIKESIETCSSLYMTFKRGEPLLGKLYMVSRVLLSLSGVVILFLAFVPICMGRVLKRPWLLSASLILAGAFFLLCTILGDKSVLLCGFIFTVVFSSFWKLKIGRLLMGGLLAAILINWISLVRERSSLIFCAKNEAVSMPIEDALISSRIIKPSKAPQLSATGQRVIYDNFFLLARSSISLFDNGETVSVFSTYALLRHNVPLYKGQSIKFLLASLIPKFLGVPRPENPQDYFLRMTGMNNGIGWGLNYFTDWVMNFGWWGGILGALILSLFHFSFFYYSQFSVLGKIGFAAIVSSLPFFLRSGLHFKEPFQVMGYAIIMFLFLPVNFRFLETQLRQYFIPQPKPEFQN